MHTKTATDRTNLISTDFLHERNNKAKQAAEAMKKVFPTEERKGVVIGTRPQIAKAIARKPTEATQKF